MRRDYRGEIIQMVEGIQSTGILRKIYRLVRMMYRAEVRK